MDEMDRLSVDAGAVVGELIEPAFLFAPIELVRPVRCQGSKVVRIGAGRPRIARRADGKASSPEPLPQILEHPGRDRDRERLGWDMPVICHSPPSA